MMNPAYEIRLVKENLDLSVALLQAVQDEKVTANQIFRDGSEELFIAFAVNRNGPDQIELKRRVTNQVRAAFVFAVIQTQRSLDRVFSDAPIEEESPDLQAARCVMYLLYNTVAPNLFTPVWDCPPRYRRRFEVRPINLLLDAAELNGKGLSWDHVGGLPQFLDLLQYFANQIEDLPEIDKPAIASFVAANNVLVETPADEFRVESLPVEALSIESLLHEPEPEVIPAGLATVEDIDGPVARFIVGRCDLDSNVRTTAKELYAGFLEWCLETGQDDISQRSFGMQLTATGLDRRRRGRGTHWWEGIRLSEPDEEPAGKVAACSLELTNGHYKGYQPEFGP